MKTQSWRDIDEWHLLLDWLCKERGYRDNGALASELGRLSERDGAHDYETALKSVHHWRDGKHLPQKRNFALLTRILAVDKDKDLLRKWNELYATARRGGTNADAVIDAGITPADKTARSRRILVWFLGLGSAFFAGIVFAAYLQGVYLMADQRTDIMMRKGETVLINAGYGNCGGAPDWNTIALRLPNATTGVFVDGGTRTRFSIACGGFAKTRAIRFTASARGEETFTLLGVPQRISVD